MISALKHFFQAKSDADRNVRDGLSFYVSVTGDRYFNIYLAPLLQSIDELYYGEVGSPLKFFEYMASGVPTVATRVGHMRDFRNCPLAVEWCDPDDPTSLERAMTQVLIRYPRKKDGYKENMSFAMGFTWKKRMERILSRIDIR